MANEFRTCVAAMRAWRAGGGTRKHVTDWLAANEDLPGHLRTIVTPTAVRLEDGQPCSAMPGAVELREEFVARLDRGEREAGELDFAAMEAIVAQEIQSESL